jgi:hypothetical protein
MNCGHWVIGVTLWPRDEVGLVTLDQMRGGIDECPANGPRRRSWDAIRRCHARSSPTCMSGGIRDLRGSRDRASERQDFGVSSCSNCTPRTVSLASRPAAPALGRKVPNSSHTRPSPWPTTAAHRRTVVAKGGKVGVLGPGPRHHLGADVLRGPRFGVQRPIAPQRNRLPNI